MDETTLKHLVTALIAIATFSQPAGAVSQVTATDGNPTQVNAGHLNNWSFVHTGPHSWRIVSGGTIAIRLISPVDTKSATIGDAVQAQLVDNIVSGNNVIAAQGATVTGHVTLVDKATRVIKADIPSHHWLNASGALGLEFDEVVTNPGEHLTFDAVPVPESAITRADAQEDQLVVDKRGEITPKFNGVKYGAMGAAIEGADIATGPIGLAVGPILSGITGAVSPAFAFGKPSQDVTGHRRIKGFFMGMVRGLPGGFLISGASTHGQDVYLSTGDIVQLQLKSK
jgi:hypothetical protein